MSAREVGINQSESALPFFFYGTLRKGHHNARMLPADEPRFLGRVDGYTMHYAAPGFKGYPVICRSRDKRNYVLGEYMWLDVLDPATQRMVDMELGAGYRMVPVSVVREDGSTIGALAFEMDHDFVGARIPSGDWNDQ